MNRCKCGFPMQMTLRVFTSGCKNIGTCYKCGRERQFKLNSEEDEKRVMNQANYYVLQAQARG
jgi:hypothetical protein